VIRSFAKFPGIPGLPALMLPVLLSVLQVPVLAAAADQPAVSLPSEVDLSTVLRLAREASPRLMIEREAVSGAEARRITAGVLPNPRIALARARPSGGAATLFDGRNQNDAAVEFPLLIAGQRGARIEAAERWIEAARARVQVSENALAEEVAVAFLAILSVQERIEALTETVERISRIREIVAARESSGLASRYDLARVDVERAAIQARLAEQAGDRADATGALAVLLGVPGWTPRATGSLVPFTQAPGRPGSGALAVAPAGDRTQIAANHPSVVAAGREEVAASAAIDVAQRERWPVPSIGVGRMWTNDPYGSANVLGLSVEVPIFDTRRGPLEEARAEARAASFRRSLVEAQVNASLDRYETVVQRRREALDRFDADAGSRLPMLQTMAEDAYRFGRASILEWLDATRTQYEQRLVRVDLVSGLAEAQVRLRGAQGLLGSAGW
jgi:cobalt-zinc-cadmium efflux system outer membrane protein